MSSARYVTVAGDLILLPSRCDVIFQLNAPALIKLFSVSHGNFMFTQVICRFGRVVWLGVFLVGITVMSYQIIDRIIHYYQWKTTVNVDVNFNDSLRFPAITLCNQNTFR